MKHFSLRSERSRFSIRVVPERQLQEDRFASCGQIKVTRRCGPTEQTEEKAHLFGVKVVLSGEEICTISKQVTRLRPGSVLLIPQGAKLSTQRFGQSTSVLVEFPLTLAREALKDAAQLRNGQVPIRPVEELLISFPMHARGLPGGWEKMFRTVQDASCDLNVADILLTLLSGAVDLVLEAHEEIARIPAVKKSAKDELFRRICLGRTAIDETPSLHLGQLAEACCLSPFHLHRVFTTAFGMTPGSYAKRRKMDISRSLLQRTKMPVKLVAYQAGFGNPSAFVRSFRNVYGVTPMNYRKASRAA